MNRVLFPVVFLVSICISMDATAALSHPPNLRSEDAAFAGLANEYIAGYLAWRPQTGTSLGLHQYDGKVTDFSKASLDRELARLKSFDARLDALHPERLSKGAAYDFQILQSAVKREIFNFDDWKVYTKNPMTYADVLDVNIYIKRDFAPLEERVRSIINVLKQASAVTANAKANLEDSLAKPLIETAIEEASGSADFLGKDLVDALRGVTNATLMADFTHANSRAIEEMRGYAKWLKEEKLPKASDHFALGRDNYIKLIKYGEMLDESPEQILEIGMRELKAKQEAFANAAREIDPNHKPVEVFQKIQKDHPFATNLISDTAQDLEAIRKFIADHGLISLPSPVRAQVTETPQYLRATSFASMDTPGPFETKATEAYYYVTPVEQDWPDQQKEEWLTAFNYYTTDIVSVHEVYPGHYVQFLHLNASRATRIEKMFNSYAFVEGWAHYTEQMMVDEGFGSGPDKLKAAKYRLAQADEALLRVCRLCASIKMHCQGMTVAEAAKFFQDNCYYEAKPALSEATRGAFDPEYLYYTVGKLELLKLREDYRKQEGSNFSLRKFNDEVLKHGAPPVKLLREVMLKDSTKWRETL